MRHLLAALKSPAWGIRTLHEAHQYAQQKQAFADAYKTGYARGYQAGRDER